VQNSRLAANVVALSLCILFLFAGSLWIWRPGIQQDEALFAAGIYPPFFRENNVRAFRHEFPLMVMTYVGTLKAVIYRTVVFPFFEPTAASVRLPALLIGAASVWLFFRLCLRVVSTRAALFGTALLATDVSYLLTIRWDWGPVALQHFCLLAGVLAVIRFSQEKQLRWLAAGFFMFGLGTWDKALFSWSLAALGVATLAVAPRFARELLKPRPAGIAAVAFLTGALPLVIYNVRQHWTTLRSNARWSSNLLGAKTALVWDTLQGSSLFGTVPRDDWDGPLVQPKTTAERALVTVTTMAGMPRSTCSGWLLVAAVAVVPVAREHRRAILFALIFSVVLWLQMAFTDQAGTGTHHTVLLWPAPPFIIAAALSGAVKRSGGWTVLASAAVVVTCLINLLVVGTHYTNVIRNGGVPAWTEAIWPAVDAFKNDPPAELALLDWGFFDTFRLLYQGQVKLSGINVAGGPNDVKYARLKLTEPGVWFVSHTPGSEIDEGSLKRFLDFMTSEGFQPANLRIFKDLNGRPIIQAFRAEPK
jgi:hypothetical protein